MECVRACVCVEGRGCIFHVPLCLTHTSHGFEIDLGSQKLRNVQESRFMVQNTRNLHLVTIIISPNLSQNLKGPKALRLKSLIFKFIGNLVSRHDRENQYRGINTFEEG
jgi:hypothetical protein